MTSGSAPSADDPASESSTAPTAGLSIETATTGLPDDLPVRTLSLLGALQKAFQTGWTLGRELPNMEEPPELGFLLSVDEETKELNVKIVTP